MLKHGHVIALCILLSACAAKQANMPQSSAHVSVRPCDEVLDVRFEQFPASETDVKVLTTWVTEKFDKMPIKTSISDGTTALGWSLSKDTQPDRTFKLKIGKSESEMQIEYAHNPPTIGDVLRCGGIPDGYQAKNQATSIDTAYLDFHIGYRSRQTIAGVDRFGEFIPPTLGTVVTYIQVKSSTAPEFNSLKPWPGQI